MKKIIVLMLALIMCAFSFVSCDDINEDQSPDVTTAVQQTTPESENPDELYNGHSSAKLLPVERKSDGMQAISCVCIIADIRESAYRQTRIITRGMISAEVASQLCLDLRAASTMLMIFCVKIAGHADTIAEKNIQNIAVGRSFG